MSKTRHPFSLKEIYTFFLRRYNQGTLVAAAAAAAKSLQSCPDSVRPHRRQPSRLPCPWDSSGKELWSGLPFLLQCVKVKSESEDAQSCPTRSDTMDCSPPGSSIHGVCHSQGQPKRKAEIPVVTRESRRNSRKTMESPMDGGAWWAAVHGVAESWT